MLYEVITGLTLIEASACGLPVVATHDGGPKDIINNCQNGLLVDPMNTDDIAKAIKSILIDTDKWKDYSINGIKGLHKHYTWDAHINRYLKDLEIFSDGRKPQAICKQQGKLPIVV